MRARWVVGVLPALSAMALSCGSGDTGNLFTSSSASGSVSSGGASNHGGAASVGEGGLSGATTTAGGGSGSALAGASSHGGSANGGAAQGGASHGGASHGGSSGHGGAASSGAGGSSAGNSGHAGGNGNAGSAGAGAGAGGISGVAGTTGSGGTGGASCSDNQGCDESEYCAKANCTALAQGHCTPSPTDCSDVKSTVVCGCDGLSYHDPCLLHQNRQNSAGLDTGACAKVAQGTVTCTADDDSACTDLGGVCALKVEASCAVAPNKGLCWILPAACPGSDDQTAQSCATEQNACMSECSAIKAQQSYLVSASCN